ncbi:hypothetical protein ACWEGM_36175, partial [Streptomyces nigra]
MPAPDGTTTNTVTTEPSFPGADILVPLADALGPAPRPATESTTTTTTTDGGPMSATTAPPPEKVPTESATPPRGKGAALDPGASAVPPAAKLATMSRPWTETATDLHLETGQTAGTGGTAPGTAGGRGPGAGGTPPPPASPDTPVAQPPRGRLVVRPTRSAGHEGSPDDGATPARATVITTLDGHTIPLGQLRRWVPETAATPRPGRAVRTLTVSQDPADDGTPRDTGRRALLDQDTFRGVRTTSGPTPSGPVRTVFTGPPAALPGAGTDEGADYFVGHGTPRTVTLGTDDAARPAVKVSGVQLGEVLKSWARDGDRSRPLVLFSCETGRQPRVAGLPVAQHVANRTGRSVYAPTTEAGTARDGNGDVRAVLTEGTDGPGRWRLFTPEPGGADLDALARDAGLHAGPGPADAFARARTLQQIRTLRDVLGPDAEQRPENKELLAGLAYVDSLRWLNPDTASRYGDGRMTPDLLRRMVGDRPGAAVDPATGPTTDQYTDFLRAAAALRDSATPDTTLDALLPPPPPALPPDTLVSPDDVRGLTYAPSARITWSLSSAPLPLSELALSAEDTAELARRRPDLAP